MIKGITAIQKIERRSDFETLVELFSALGFEPGTGWKTAKSEGSPFLAPIGNLELVNGDAPPHTNLWVEVTDLDSVREFFRHKKIKPSVEVYDTDWGSRAFVVEPVKKLKIAFWQPNRPKANAIEGDLSATGMRFALVVARWNSFITERLLQGALNALRRSGCKEQDITVVRVPGSFEIPSEARTLAETGSYDAIITLGCLIRGETTHYEHIATEVTRGIGQSAQQTGVPHTYGVLTCENLEQAIDRAGLKAGNKGHEAAISAIEMVSLKRKTRGMASKSRAT
ncbi:MAG TPA: 6,7-dimethyl-8-ribityllumazine synthase [Candidatus Limnocylindrales bacterium]|nr:6,7-dimethyl-8-ribityllumazine synthase [Candidatus Limnocylindrales bacterium]